MQPAFLEDRNVAGENGSSSEPQPERDLSAPSKYLAWTGWLNQIVGLILFIPASFVIAMLIVAMRLSSRGPGIYRQTRVGLHGRTFVLYKIRTMCQEAEAKSGPVWTAKNDTRITALGRLLRKAHLDELPQLINVVKGDMVLVGPRPERPEFTHHLAQSVPGYIDRLTAKPGITGASQVLLPPDSDLDSVRLKLAGDLKYIRLAGLVLDLRIVTCTVLRMFGISGPKVARLFGFSSNWIQDPMFDQGHSKPMPHLSSRDPNAAPELALSTGGIGLAGVSTVPGDSANNETLDQPYASANPGLPR